MRGAFTSLAVAGGLMVLVNACTFRPPAPPDISPPAALQAGHPIDSAGLRRYLAMASTNLLAQGKLSTNALRAVGRKTCPLQLAAPPACALTSAELAKKVEPSVVVLGRLAWNPNGPYLAQSMTGFFITESGALVTSREVLGKGVLGLVAMTRDGRVWPVRQVLAADGPLLILQVAGQGFAPLPVAPGAQSGESVWVLSHPDYHYYTLTAGVISGYLSLAANNAELTTMMVTADFGTGSSGAPVLNAAGAVVGIAWTVHPLFFSNSYWPKAMSIKLTIPSAALLKMVQNQTS